MPNLEAKAAWVPVREIGIELARGGPNGNMNEQATALLARTEYLNQEKASKFEIVQGHYEFNTYAEFNAIKSTLPLNCTVIINEIPTGTQTWGQGTNRWNGTTLTKSAYDPLPQAKADATTKANAAEVSAKEYADAQKVQKHIGFNRKGILYEVTDAEGNQTWLQVSSEDGMPTLFAKGVIQKSVNLNLNDLVISIGEKLLYSLQDKLGNATALSIRESDGMFAQFVIDNIAERLNLAPPDLAELQYKPNPSDFQILSSIARGLARHVEARPLPSQVTDAVNSTGQNIRLTFPNSYIDATPLILVICFEGIGDPSLDIRGAYTDVLNHGVVWAKCSFHGNSYGNPAAMQDAKEVYQKACEIAPIGGVIIAGNSMGGVAAFNTLTTEAVPNIIGLHLTDPVFSLRHRYDNGRAGDINAAYNCTAETYAEKTKGYDPDLQHWSKFKGVPIKVVATSNDTAVPMAFHTNKMVEKLNSHNDVQVIDTLAPNHNSPEQFNVTELIAFINKCASGTVITNI